MALTLPRESVIATSPACHGRLASGQGLFSLQSFLQNLQDTIGRGSGFYARKAPSLGWLMRAA
ncbi:hypothetical protein, partial [Mesorhizobium sp.]|uniref:hypothetical protein n=1 Tax=Mesorhizobium sp. TaxID=1871066 RepID=UPI002580161F